MHQDARDLRTIAKHLRDNRGIAVMPTFANTLEQIAVKLDEVDKLVSAARSHCEDTATLSSGLRTRLMLCAALQPFAQVK